MSYATAEPPPEAGVMDAVVVEEHDAAGFAYEMFFGGTPWDGIVLGGGFVGTNLGASFPLATYAAFVQYYPDATGGLHVQAIGAMSLLATGSRRFGPTGALGAGYDGWIGRQTCLGAFARVGYTGIFADDQAESIGSAFFMLSGTFTWH